jgi:hypothetical protein
MQQSRPVWHTSPCPIEMLDHRNARKYRWETWLRDIVATLLLYGRFVREPLNVLSESVYIGILENIDHHDDLVITAKGDGISKKMARGGLPYRRCEIACRVRSKSQSARCAMRLT